MPTVVLLSVLHCQAAKLAPTLLDALGVLQLKLVLQLKEEFLLVPIFKELVLNVAIDTIVILA